MEGKDTIKIVNKHELISSEYCNEVNTHGHSKLYKQNSIFINTTGNLKHTRINRNLYVGGYNRFKMHWTKRENSAGEKKEFEKRRKQKKMKIQRRDEEQNKGP